MKLNNKWLCVLLALLLTLIAASALATGETEAPKLEIPVSISADVEPLTPDTYIVWLEAQTEGAPMPDGTEDGRFTMDRTGPGDITFPELSFDYGVYIYQMGQTPGSHPSATAYDDTKYTITVIRPHVGSFSVVIESDKGEKVTDITFENLYAETSVSASKVWNDNENQDGKRDTVYFVLSGNTMDETGLMRPVPLPVVTVRSIPADAEGEALKVTWEGLPVFYRGTAIDYTVTERGIYEKEDGFYIKLKDGAEYAVVISGDMEDGFTVTNSYTPEETEATVKKIWDDGNNQDGIRPDTLVMTLSNGIEVTLEEANNWEATVSNLPKYEDGQVIEYTWSETEPDGYKQTAYSATGTVTMITNTHATDTTSVSVVKIWDDGSNQDGIRPDSVTVSLYDGDTQVGDPVTLNEGNKWIYTWENLPKNKDGSEIVYTWKEEPVPAGYTLQDPVVEGRITKLTNFHQPEEIALSVEKVWVDGENGLNTRPANVVITLSDGQTVVLTESNGWQATLDHLPKYEEGNEIVYTWKEEPVPGYTTSQAPKATDKNTTVFTNTIIQEKIPVGGTKTWVDGGREHNNASELVLILTQTSAKPGSPKLVPDIACIWTGNDYSFVELDRFDPEGYEYIYEVTEEPVSGYTTVQNGYDFTNTIEDKEDVEITGTKTWVDGGKEHDNANELTMTLTRTSAKPGSTAETLDVSPVWDGGKYTFSGLDQYDEEGYEYTYDVNEAPVTGYDTEKNGFDFTNTIQDKEDVEISGTKTWVDGKKEHDNAAELTLTLTRTSAKAGSTAETVDVSPAWDGGKYTFSGLDQYDEEGYEYTYEVTEAPVPGYDTVQNGFNFTNTVTQEDITVTGTKTWVDGGKEHDNAKEIKLTLTRTANGSRQTVTDVPVQWEGDTYTYSGLPKYDKSGYEYTYEVTEAPVPGYTTEQDNLDFTNTIEDKEDVEITGKKTWVDGGKEHDNTTELTLTLTRTSAKEGSAPETLDLSPVWSGNSYTYTGLERYDAEGYEYAYEVTEAPVPGYDTAVDGFNFTNTVTQEEVEISGTKTWIDGGKEHDNAKEIKLTLWRAANGARQSVTDVPVQWEDDTYTYSGLPKYDKSGYEYTYEVTETPVPGYTTEQNDFNFTNTIEDKEDVEITGTKTWVDGKKEHDNATELTLTLTRTSAKEGSTPETLDLSPAWSGNSYTYTGLERYDAEGYEYAYEVTEAPVPGYDTAVDGFNFTNTVTQEEVEISGTKTWIDGGKEHDNTKEIKLTLWRTANGARQSVTDVPVQWEDDTYTYSGLPKYDKSGYEYTYEVTETRIPGYTTEQDGCDFTNTITQKKIKVDGVKTWVDGKKEHDNATELTLTLTRTSAKPGSTEETLDVSPVWSGNEYAFEDLDQYDAEGYEYTYQVTEAKVPGYDTESTSPRPNRFNFTNTITQEEIDISGTKTWVDGGKEHNNAAEITLRLSRTANGKEKPLTGLTPTWEGNTYTFSGLPRYDESGYEYTYTISEQQLLPGYEEPEIDGLNITNRLKQEKIDVTGTKTWVDGGKEHDNATELTLTLTRTSGKEGSTPEPLDVSPAWDGSKYTFADLDRYDEERYEYTYEVTEAPLAGYDTERTSPNPNQFNFKNTITQEEITITGTKTWVDGGKEHDNAAEITLILKRTSAKEGPEEVTDAEVTWNGKTYTFSGQPRYDAKGYEYTYEVEEKEVPGYTTKQNGFNFTNTLKERDITVVKFWEDGKNAEGTRPQSLNLTLTGGGKETTVTLTAADRYDEEAMAAAGLDPENVWIKTISVPAYDEQGREIKYTWEEKDVPSGYECEIYPDDELTVIVNTRSLKLTVRKIWVDRGYTHPGTLIMTLTGGGKSQPVTLKEDNNWVETIVVPKYDADGNEIQYVWTEPSISNYKLIGVKTFGSGDERTTEFTNRRIIIAPPGPPTPRTPTPTPRPTPKPDAPIEDVGTPLGVGPVYINVGDCLE